MGRIWMHGHAQLHEARRMSSLAGWSSEDVSVSHGPLMASGGHVHRGIVDSAQARAASQRVCPRLLQCETNSLTDTFPGEARDDSGQDRIQT